MTNHLIEYFIYFITLRFELITLTLKLKTLKYVIHLRLLTCK